MVNVFARELSSGLASLVKEIDKSVSENESKQMAAFVVLLTDDPDEAETKIKEFAKTHEIKNVPLTVFDGIAGPGNYRIAKDADVTVHMWKQQRVKSNHAFGEGELNKKSIAKLMESTDTILE